MDQDGLIDGDDNGDDDDVVSTIYLSLIFSNPECRKSLLLLSKLPLRPTKTPNCISSQQQ